MKILVLGTSDVAGHTIALYFKEQGHGVYALSRKQSLFCTWIGGDTFGIDFLKNIVTTGNYNAIINCIGLLNQFADPAPEKAVYINNYLPHQIVAWLTDTSTRFIQMSTDCVFVGNAGPYDECFVPDRCSYYDRTKALGEIMDGKNLTLRNSIIGPGINEHGIGLFHWFMKQHTPINGLTKAIWTGVTTLILTKAIERALQANLTGLYSLVNNKNISKYSLLCLFNKYFKNNEIRVAKSEKLILDKTLLNKHTGFDFEVPSYKQMIIEMKEWIDNHKDIHSLY